jgi:hypothetical protein
VLNSTKEEEKKSKKGRKRGRENDLSFIPILNTANSGEGVSRV